ncbi:MAG: MFS transporter [Actinomycetota bacterium]
MTGHTPSTATRSPGLALAALCAATLMIILDGTIVTVALPSIQRDLGFSAGGATWVLNAYLIAFGGLLLFAGRLGDLIGRKRMFLAGMTVFTATSLLCGLALNRALLVSMRFGQGAGGAMITAVSLGMITAMYPEPAPRARAIAAYSFVGAFGASAGLVAGGVLTQALSWRWIFFVNLPVALAAAIPAVWLLPRERGTGLRAGADAPGAVLVTAGLMTGIYTIAETSRFGWASARTLGLAAVSAALLTAFAVRQAKAAVPLLPLRVLAPRDVWGANLAQVLVIGAAFGFQVLITLYQQRVLGYGPAAAGLGLLPTAVVIGAVSLGLSARLIARLGARTVLLAGLALIVAALAVLASGPVHGSYLVHILPALVAFGAGGGLTLPALAGLAMSGAGPDDAGLVSGLFSTTQQGGAAVGLAALAALAAARTAGLQHAGLGTAAALAGGYHLAFGVGAGLGVTALVVVAAVLRPSGPAASGASAASGAASPGQAASAPVPDDAACGGDSAPRRDPASSCAAR